MRTERSCIIALLAALAVVPTACSPNDEMKSDSNRQPIIACEVTDGGVDQTGLNALALAGLTRAEKELHAATRVQAGFEPDIQAQVDQGCDIIISVGFRLADATLAAAEANPDDKFAIVDYWFDFQSAEDLTRKNVRLLAFRSDQAAFLAGYLAAGMTRTGKIATFGGINVPPVRTVMNGFLAGVRAYKQDNHARIEVLGWDGTSGIFTGDFFNQRKSRRVTEEMIAKGADIILPVGAGATGAAEAAQDASDVLLIGTDADQAILTPESADLWLTSIQKGANSAVFDTIASASEGSFDGGLYVGTLENRGVWLAPYHQLDTEIPPKLKSKLRELREGISDGWVSVDPADYVPYDVHHRHHHP